MFLQNLIKLFLFCKLPYILYNRMILMEQLSNMSWRFVIVNHISFFEWFEFVRLESYILVAFPNTLF